MMVNNDELAEVSLTTTNNIKIQTYRFEHTKDLHSRKSSLRTLIWRRLPAFSAYLVCFTFGIMVGWCSPMYPNLLLKESEIPVDMDATAMIAGFLMIGNMFGTLPAHFVPFGTKYGILAGLILMMISWFVMWQAGNIYCILVSRFLIGFGNSFGTHHGKEYIKQMSEKPLRDNLVKSVQIYIGIGILVGYCFGPYVDFRTYSVIALIVTTVICVYSLFLPHSPVELIRYDNISKAETVLAYLKPGVDIDREIKEIKSNLHDQNLDLGLDIIRNKTLSCNFTILMFLIFFQQLCGAPSCKEEELGQDLMECFRLSGKSEIGRHSRFVENLKLGVIQDSVTDIVQML
ncbi:Sugar transporter [Popillia japonica]|uniref:Sugar transporter n=1 Tax=Popillia japonica TaxID=7064 RepID=A0AAW1MD67_POPJA